MERMLSLEEQRLTDQLVTTQAQLEATKRELAEANKLLTEAEQLFTRLDISSDCRGTLRYYDYDLFMNTRDFLAKQEEQR